MMYKGKEGAMCHRFYKGAHAIMIVIDLSNVETFENIEVAFEQTAKYAKKNVSAILVGNCSDKVAQRVISFSEAAVS